MDIACLVYSSLGNSKHILYVCGNVIQSLIYYYYYYYYYYYNY